MCGSALQVWGGAGERAAAQGAPPADPGPLKTRRRRGRPRLARRTRRTVYSLRRRVRQILEFRHSSDLSFDTDILGIRVSV